MKSNWKALCSALLFIALTGIIACQKESSNSDNTTVTTEEATTVSQEHVEAEGDDDDMAEIGLSAGADLDLALKTMGADGSLSTTTNIGARLDLFVDLVYKLGPCATITVTPNDTTYPKTVTIDYGSTGCLCKDGRFRKGVIKLTFSAPLRTYGATLTMTVDGYYVNRKHIEGTRIITNLSADGTVKYTVEVKDGKITWPSGRGFAHVGMRTVTQLSGMDTRTVRDDVYSIEINATTTYNNGIKVVRITESPLIKSLSCDHFVKGKLKIVINDLTFYIDFGNGNCDNKAILVNAQTNVETEITLP